MSINPSIPQRDEGVYKLPPEQTKIPKPSSTQAPKPKAKWKEETSVSKIPQPSSSAIKGRETKITGTLQKAEDSKESKKTDQVVLQVIKLPVKSEHPGASAAYEAVVEYTKTPEEDTLEALESLLEGPEPEQIAEFPQGPSFPPEIGVSSPVWVGQAESPTGVVSPPGSPIEGQEPLEMTHGPLSPSSVNESPKRNPEAEDLIKDIENWDQEVVELDNEIARLDKEIDALQTGDEGITRLQDQYNDIERVRGKKLTEMQKLREQKVGASDQRERDKIEADILSLNEASQQDQEELDATKELLSSLNESLGVLTEEREGKVEERTMKKYEIEDGIANLLRLGVQLQR